MHFGVHLESLQYTGHEMLHRNGNECALLVQVAISVLLII